jgi:N12 class adenine-specific DNA methylase
MDALRTLRLVQADDRPATVGEQRYLARWAGWGALAAVFDTDPADPDRWAARYGHARAELDRLFTPAELTAAARTTINAHYTDVAYAAAIWEAVTGLGFTGGRVLEPGCGAGVFLGLAPAGTDLVGIEWDPTTAAIARLLYPNATVLAESFADTRVAEGSFDVVVGNVPFGDVVLTDPRHNPSGLSIHNHFIVKGLHLTRPGGLVAVLTSRYTMDAVNPAARREMAALADLVGAVRLPAGAHRRAAGTDAVTDLLLLRRRDPDTRPAGADWERTRRIEVDGVALAVNEYFHTNPQHVLGRFALGGAYRGDELTVDGDPDAEAGLRDVLATIVAQATVDGLGMTDRPAGFEPRPVAYAQRSRQPDGFLQAHPDGAFTRVSGRVEVPHTPPASQADELRLLLRLRDVEVALLEAEAASIDDTDQMDDLRERLNEVYDGYVAAFGPINRYGQRRTGRVDPDTGADILARVYPSQGGFRDDPYCAAVKGLEDLDPVRGTTRKADIFRQRVVAPRSPRLGADTPADALAICLDTHGRADLAHIARLLGVDEPQARTQLGELVFDDPDTGDLVAAPAYLSGNVRAKLEAARTAAASDPRLAVNVTALERVLPPDLGPGDIAARLGASWIDATYVQQFLAEILDDPTIVVEHPYAAVWAVRSQRSDTVLATSRWGTEECSAPQIAQHLLEQRTIRLYDEVGDGKRVFNPDATLAAQEKAQQVGEAFAEWVWRDPARAAQLVATYNAMFNSLALRSYDQVPLTLPGLAVSFTPRPHQLAAVARVIAEPSVGLWHEVGAGKTAEMAMAAMELRRLGLARKPAIVVPNHMLAQFSSEFHQLYPRARLLAASSDDLTAERRRLFVAKAATGDWDAIVITRGAFERIPMSREAQAGYLRGEVDALAEAIQRARTGGARLTVKRLETMKLRAEERLKSKLDGEKDPGITFEQTGVDYLFVDEAHGYKNLRTPSNIPGMSVDGSNRASDLHMKIEYLRSRHPRTVTLASATPIANTMGEAYTMLRYLRPDLLDALHVDAFDVFAATFGEVVTAVEVAPEGGVRIGSRFAKFVNVPELLRPWHVAGDVKTADDLNLPTPLLAERGEDGKRLPETVVVAPSQELKDFIALLGERADDVRSRRVDAAVDNMLKITHEGRSAALDLRLVGRATTELSKLDVAADRMAEIWRTHRDQTYLASDGSAHPTPGGLQIVFADLGTPTGDGFSAYHALRDKLAQRGLPREQVRFIHEAKTDRDKADLFAACRDGRISVLVGSTEKMGMGTNVQARAVALHHLDCPWRPADLQQREGRILRQGNQNPEVRIVRFVTEASFDGYSWQTVTRKAAFIAQVMRGRLDVREIEDIGDNALSYNEVKALAAGNPLLIDHAQAQAELTRLERLQRAHRHGQDSLRYTIATTTRSLESLRQRLSATDAAIGRRVDTRADAFTMTVNSIAHSARSPAGQALRGVLERLLADRRLPSGTRRTIGALGGFDISATLYRDHERRASLTVELVDAPGAVLTLTPVELAQADLVIRLENRLHDLDSIATNTLADIGRAEADIAHATTQLDVPFRHADALDTARDRFAELDDALTAEAEPPPPPPALTPAPTPGPGSTPVVEVPIDSALDLDAWFDTRAAAWPAPPSGWDRHYIASMAADIACAHPVQAAALAGDATAYTAAHDGELRRIIDAAVASGVLARDGFWGSCLTVPALRAELAAATRAAAYTAIRTGAGRLGITVGPTVGDDRRQLPSDPDPAGVSGARVSFAGPLSITTDPLPPHEAPTPADPLRATRRR